MTKKSPTETSTNQVTEETSKLPEKETNKNDEIQEQEEMMERSCPIKSNTKTKLGNVEWDENVEV